MFETLKRWFGPIGTPPPPAAEGRRHRVDRIILPASAVAGVAEDPAALVAALGGFVSAMRERGQYLDDEMPLAALQADAAAHYLDLALRDGHAGAVRAFAPGGAAEALAGAGLEAAGAAAHLAVFRGAMTWAGLAEGTGDQGREEDGATLAELDVLLGEAEARDPLSPRLAAWIAAREDVQIVPDDTLQHLYTHTARLNPRRAARQAAGAAARLAHMLESRVWAGAGLAAASCHPGEVLRDVEEGIREDGPIAVHTDGGPRWLELSDSGASLSASGALLAEVAGAEIEAARAQARTLSAGAAAELVLARAGLAPETAVLTLAGTGEALRIRALAEGRLFSIEILPDAAVLGTDADDTPLARATRDEIDQHQRRIATAG